MSKNRNGFAGLITAKPEQQKFNEKDLKRAAIELASRANFYRDIIDVCSLFASHQAPIETGCAALLAIIGTAISRRGYESIYQKIQSANDDIDLTLNELALDVGLQVHDVKNKNPPQRIGYV